jgi:hypothetical protein
MVWLLEDVGSPEWIEMNLKVRSDPHLYKKWFRIGERHIQQHRYNWSIDIKMKPPLGCYFA